jgi:hypothetical protein
MTASATRRSWEDAERFNTELAAFVRMANKTN